MIYTKMGALLSGAKSEYRYALFREWSDDPRRLVVIGLNPSTADARQDDPTIRRCVAFARREGFGGLTMLNLFAFRSTDPNVLRNMPDPVGPMNDEVIFTHTRAGEALVLAAWGTVPYFQWRAIEVCQIVPDLACLGLTKDGSPRHPLYVRGGTKFINYPYPHGATVRREEPSHD